MTIDHRFRRRRRGYIHRKIEEQRTAKLALSLAGCTPRTSRREVGGFLAAKSRIARSSRKRRACFLSTRGILRKFNYYVNYRGSKMSKEQHFAFAFPESINDLDSEKENCFSLYFSLYLYCNVCLTIRCF